MFSSWHAQPCHQPSINLRAVGGDACWAARKQMVFASMTDARLLPRTPAQTEIDTQKEDHRPNCCDPLKADHSTATASVSHKATTWTTQGILLVGFRSRMEVRWSVTLRGWHWDESMTLQINHDKICFIDTMPLKTYGKVIRRQYCMLASYWFRHPINWLCDKS